MCVCSCFIMDVLPIVHDLRRNYYFPVVYVMENAWHCYDQCWMDCGFNFCGVNILYYVGEKYFLRIGNSSSVPRGAGLVFIFLKIKKEISNVKLK